MSRRQVPGCPADHMCGSLVKLSVDKCVCLRGGPEPLAQDQGARFPKHNITPTKAVEFVKMSIIADLVLDTGQP